MAVYPHPYQPKILVAYTWFGSRVPTPRRFDDDDWSFCRRFPRLGWPLFMLWARCRSVGIVQLRYWGRVR